MKRLSKAGLSRRFVRNFDDRAEPQFFRTLVPGRPQPWRPEKQVPPNPKTLKWQWEPEHIPTPQEYEQFPGVITIFGGSGFLGKYLVESLLKRPEVNKIRVTTRWPKEYAESFPAHWKGKVFAEYVNITDQHNVLAACEGSQGLINMMGIQYECELSFYEAHVQSAKWISHSANTVMASRVIHVSSLASRVDSWSRYSETKFRGEDAALANFPWTTILRFGPLFGKSSPYLKKFVDYLKYTPIYLCPASETTIQPTYAGDAAEAIVSALAKPETRQFQYDLGGPKIYSHSELVKEIMRLKKVKRPVVPVPGVVGDVIAAGLQWLPDPLITRDHIYLLRSHHVTNHSLMRSWSDIIPGYYPKSLEEALDK